MKSRTIPACHKSHKQGDADNEQRDSDICGRRHLAAHFGEACKSHFDIAHETDQASSWVAELKLKIGETALLQQNRMNSRGGGYFTSDACIICLLPTFSVKYVNTGDVCSGTFPHYLLTDCLRHKG